MSHLVVLAVVKRLKRLPWKPFLGRLRGLAHLNWLEPSFKGAVVKISPLAIAFGLSLAITAHAIPTRSEQPSTALSFFRDRLHSDSLHEQTIAQTPAPDFPLQPHLLPPTLAGWNVSKAGDYFDQIEPGPVGYLIWSQFPVTVYIQPPTAAELASPFTAKRSQVWIKAVSQAVQEWNRYLPLAVIDQAASADIAVLRSPPPLQVETIPVPNQERATGQTQREPQATLQIGRARSAVTSYKVYVKGSFKEGSSKNTAASKPMLAHRFTIQLRPDQAAQYLQAAARHELGHALGIWGHSRSQSDVMYFSQVRNSPSISPRDLNTLRRVYEQPTRLGWALIE